jgi:hypothetical protein
MQVLVGTMNKAEILLNISAGKATALSGGGWERYDSIQLEYERSRRLGGM